MANQKTKRRLTVAELDARTAERERKRRLRWQQIAFLFVSVIVVLSMVITLFVR